MADWGGSDLWGSIATIGGGLISSWLASDSQSSAASNASNAQIAAGNAGIAEQRHEFDAIQQLLAPWVGSGMGALAGQVELAGLRGADAQKKAISAIESGPEFTNLAQQGENAILANASATGGLRGGNTQGALAQFRPQLLSGLINQQFNRLGSLSTGGQNSAAQQASAGIQTGANISNLMGSIGSAQAGNALAQGAANAQFWNGIGSSLGTLAGKSF